MISVLLLAFSAATAAASPATADPTMVRDAAQAIEAGRLEEARLMIARAVGAGARGAAVEQLMADLAFVSGKYADALAGYSDLAATGHKDQRVCERGAIAALELGQPGEAKPFVDCATDSDDASWAAWNARGVLADWSRDWTAADRAYARAHQLAPTQAKVVNNAGWSHVLRGDWAGALPYLEAAAALDPKSSKIADNLELARAAVAPELPRRQPNEPKREWAERLNDAGVAAELTGDKSKAVAAFTGALDASDVWYTRASNNLEAATRN